MKKPSSAARTKSFTVTSGSTTSRCATAKKPLIFNLLRGAFRYCGFDVREIAPELATAISILRAVSVSGLADDVSPQEGTRWPVRNVVNANAVTSYFALTHVSGVTRDTARRRAVARRAKPPAGPAG